MLSIARFKMKSNITAVLGLYICNEQQYSDTLVFLSRFKRKFQDIPLSISCVGTPKQYQKGLEEFWQDYPGELVTGTTERVSFSETWTRAIENVKTEKFVFIHNDMVLAPDFFEQLDSYYLTDPKDFYVYTTIEPMKMVGFPRPGKIIANFGEDFQDFKEDEFNRFVKKYQESHNLAGRGYGFYLAGYTESLKDVGGFDYVTFNPVFCEDDDLMVRIRKKGYILKTAPRAIVYHFGSKTTRDIDFAGMSRPEIESNRRFARKWGFEARYLWETGYERQNEPLNTGVETIGYAWKNNFEVPIDMPINIEPLVNTEACDHPEYLKYLESINHPEKSGNLDKCDIVVVQTAPKSFEEIAYLLGDLRFHHGALEAGKVYLMNGFEIHVNNVQKNANRVDPWNYLSLLKEECKQ